MKTTLSLASTLLATTLLTAPALMSAAHAQAPVVAPNTAVLTTPAAQLELARSALRERRWNAAIDTYKPLVNTPDERIRAQARYGLALALSQVGEEEQAFNALEGTLSDPSALGVAVGALRARLALQLGEKLLAEKGPLAANPWLDRYERMVDQPDRDRFERLRGASASYDGSQPSLVLRVGVMLPLDGPLADVGNSVLHGLQLGLPSFDGRRGTRVELLIVDSSDPAKAAEAAQKLAGQNLDVVVGPLLAPAVTGAAEIFRARNTPVLALSNDKSVMGQGVYAVNYLPSGQARLAARSAVRMGKRKLAVLAPNGAYGSEAMEAFSDEARRLGATLTGSVFYDPNATDIGSSIRELTGSDEKNLPFDGLFVPAPAAKMALIKAQLSYYNVNATNVLLLGTGLWQDNLLLRPGTGMRDALFAAPPKAFAFEDLYRSTYKEPANPLALAGYDLARVLGDIAAEKQRTGRDVTSLLTRPEGYYGNGGYLRFSANGQTERGLDVVKIGASQFEVQKPALTLAPLPLPDELAPEGPNLGWGR